MVSRDTPASRLAGVLIASGALSLVALGAYFLVPLIQVQPTGSEIVTSVVIEIEEVPIEQGFTEELLSADKLAGINHGFVIEFDDSIEVLEDTDLIKVTIDGSESLPAVVIEIEGVMSVEGVAEEVSTANKPSEFDHDFVIEFDDSIEFLKDSDLIKVTITESEETPSIFAFPAGEECEFTLLLEPSSRDEVTYVGYIRVGDPDDDRSGYLCGTYVADYDSPMPN